MSDGGVTSGDGCAVATARAQCVFARARSVLTYISCQPPTPPTHSVCQCACRSSSGTMRVEIAKAYLQYMIYLYI